MNEPHRRAVNIIRWSIFWGAVLLGVYIFIYLFQPIPGFWRNVLTNLIGCLAAGLTASLATVIWRRYKKSEAAYPIWMSFALGLWAWCIADVVWGIYNLTVGVVPEVSYADLFYLLGYCFLPVALHRQYRILCHPSRRKDILTTSAIIGAEFLIALVFTLVIANFVPRDLNLGNFLDVFYPVADIGIGLIAILFVINFGSGALARPWIGLAIFAISDSLYAWLFGSGNYSYSVVFVNFPSLIADTIYLAAYLIVAVLLLNHLLLLINGPSILGSFERDVEA